MKNLKTKVVCEKLGLHKWSAISDTSWELGGVIYFECSQCEKEKREEYIG